MENNPKGGCISHPEIHFGNRSNLDLFHARRSLSHVFFAIALREKRQ
jgi:hypothetical protein